MGAATGQFGYLKNWQLCERRSCGGPTVLLLELHFKVSGGKKKKKSLISLAQTTLFWHMYMTAHLSLILTWKMCKLVATLQSFRWKREREREREREKVAFSGRKQRCCGVCKWLHISRPSWHEKFVGFCKLWNCRTCMHINAENK